MSYRTYQRELLPPPLRGETGEVFAGDLGAAKDDVVTLTKDAVYAGQLVDADGLGREAPDDALSRLGADADLEQGPIESPQDYRARILGAWDLWGWSGTVYGYCLALWRLKNPIRGARFVSASEWSAPDGLSGWSRFWPIVWTGSLAVGRYTVGPWALYGGDASAFVIWTFGDGTEYGDGSTYGSTAAVEELAEIRTVLAKWKNARDRVPALIIASGEVYGTPGLTYGDAWAFSGEAAAISQELLFGAFAYGARGYADDPTGPWHPHYGREFFV